MAVSWIDFSITNKNSISIKPFSLSLEKNDFLFLAGETCLSKLLRALAGFLPEECNCASSIRIDGQHLNDALSLMLLPKNATKSFPAHRAIGAFALDLAPSETKKRIENSAAGYGIGRNILHSKPAKISPLDLQKISLWLCSLNQSSVLFIEEPEGGFFGECRPFDFLQGLLMDKITSCIVYLADKRENVWQKSRILQFCRARIAVFCADKLVEEGDAARILENPVHAYTKEWLDPKLNMNNQLKTGALWKYCKPNCTEQYSCSAKNSVSSIMWDCEPPKLHKVVCKAYFQ
ncbi:MAG: hypothetical protein FWC26_08790 [Fibromonadales bacterium]|nr:hypothetical protein [Fibromonadales bacterium]